MELETWFKTKKYPHIGLPITIKDYNWVKKYVENPEKIRLHSFLPLIHKSYCKKKISGRPINTYSKSKREKKKSIKQAKSS